MITPEPPLYKEQTVSITELAHARIAEVLRPGDIAVDATVGNGNDTARLAALVGNKGLVFGFEIQADALQIARNRLFQDGSADHVQLFECSHAQMQSHIPGAYKGKIKAIMFNLGYLPGGDKNITTEAESTAAALDQAFHLLTKGGVLSIACYPGHHQGIRETEAVVNWVEHLPEDEAWVHRYAPIGTKRRAPELVFVLKRSVQKHGLADRLKRLFTGSPV
ncbi:MAG: 16S rRNA (cytosine(1402)-N(4))-methyltransferase [Opitutales bacterium]|nr:16S rRNA (cytosine(1402)-N(4))-methyltransferase [Opitutales bacterium]